MTLPNQTQPNQTTPERAAPDQAEFPDRLSRVMQSYDIPTSIPMKPRTYIWAEQQFTKWLQSRPFSSSAAREYIEHCRHHRKLGDSSLNIICTVLRHEAKNAHREKAISSDELLEVLDIHQRRAPSKGLYLSRSVIHEVLSKPNRRTLMGKRDIAIMACLFSGLKRTRTSTLRIENLGSISTDARPLVDEWLAAAEIREGYIFHRFRKGGHLCPEKLSSDAIWMIFKKYSAMIGTHLSPQDANRTYRKQMKPRPAKLIP